ncbi:MAG: S-layer homology domain-containing protein [Tissierellia bacterium]|nr:S-layer homology domain-containing protein [Tissierellia bacterium]
MKKKIILSIILIMVILSPFKSFNVSVLAADTEDLYKEGYARGYNAGYILAIVNNAVGKHTPYKEIPIPSRDTVFNENMDYLHDKENVNKSTFYTGYLKGREDGYNAYIGKDDSEQIEVQDGKVFGGVFGFIFGEIGGINDYKEGKSSDWLKALPKDAELSSNFNLKNLPAAERTKFISEFKLSFHKAYETAYINEMFGFKRESYEAGKEDGLYFGEILGNIFGAKDYFEGRKLDYNRNMPSDSKLKADYSLNRLNDEYTKGFIYGFKYAYKESYFTSFREAQNHIEILEDSNAYYNGYDLGEARGIIQARIDYLSGRTNSWLRSRPPASTIIKDYRLLYHPSKYIDQFVNGFWAGYSMGYTDTYKDLSTKDGYNKKSSYIVPIAGGIFQSLDNTLTLEIDGGTYYKDIILNIDVEDDNYDIDNRYISASNFYRIYVVNPSREFNNDKEIQISLEYYGDKRGGIYILRNGKWEYLNSSIEDNRIVTSVKPNILKDKGNVLAVLVDKDIKDFYDIRGHWAKEEIYTLIRKGIINGYPDQTFRPDNYITRAEFLVLLSRKYEWILPTDLENLSVFFDREAFSDFSEKQISYAVSHGFIRGYSDNYFRPNDYISYKEVEIIMRRILKDDNFTWDSIANKVIYDKKVRLSSFDSIDNKITRAEFSFLLHEFINEND